MHNDGVVCAATLSAVTAASKIGGDVDILIGGSGCSSVADEAAKLPGIRKVLCADAPVFGKPVAEDLEKLILQVQVCSSPGRRV
jgi:electron transfer flavoprotein alpha subunit